MNNQRNLAIATVVYAIVEKTSNRYLKAATVCGFMSLALMSMLMPLMLFVISMIFSTLISMTEV